MNRGGQDVPIISIRQLNRVDEMSVSCHQRIGKCLVHKGITVPKRENCTLRLKSMPSKHLSHWFLNSTIERLITLSLLVQSSMYSLHLDSFC
jgi:hypothetical protein